MKNNKLDKKKKWTNLSNNEKISYTFIVTNDLFCFSLKDNGEWNIKKKLKKKSYSFT